MGEVRFGNNKQTHIVHLRLRRRFCWMTPRTCCLADNNAMRAQDWLSKVGPICTINYHHEFLFMTEISIPSVSPSARQFILCSGVWCTAAATCFRKTSKRVVTAAAAPNVWKMMHLMRVGFWKEFIYGEFSSHSMWNEMEFTRRIILMNLWNWNSKGECAMDRTKCIAHVLLAFYCLLANYRQLTTCVEEAGFGATRINILSFLIRCRIGGLYSTAAAGRE